MKEDEGRRSNRDGGPLTGKEGGRSGRKEEREGG
jgi:hypothetical protein